MIQKSCFASVGLPNPLADGLQIHREHGKDRAPVGCTIPVNKSLFSILYSLLLAFWLVGCVSPPIPTTGPLRPCDAPCWNGITPGQTSLDEARTILKSYIQPADYLSESVFMDESVELSWYAANKGLNAVGVNDGVVTMVSINVENQTAADVLAQYGPPPFQLGLQRQGSERVLYAVTFLYPERGLSILLRTGRSSLLRPSPARTFVIQADTPVSAIRYFSPGSVEALVARLPEVRRSQNVELAVFRLRPWNGYGDESLRPFDVPAN